MIYVTLVGGAAYYVATNFMHINTWTGVAIFVSVCVLLFLGLKA